MTVSIATDQLVQEGRFRAMGTDAHVIIVGGNDEMLAIATDRIEHLEAHWSRFRDNSDISRLNQQVGRLCAVDIDTALMIERSIELWRVTGGSVDPLVLGAVRNAGYDRTFAEIRTGDQPSTTERTTRSIDPRPWCPVACTDIEIVRNLGGADAASVRLPVGSGFDPGGIGKGVAADIIVGELMAAGATGTCVNLGGDLRVSGTAPRSTNWIVAVDHPQRDESMLTLAIVEGAAATSSTLRRSWTVDGFRRHHLIDTTTGEPSRSDLVQATVVAAQAWVAEGFAKAVLLRGGPHPFDLLPIGIEAMAIDRDGNVMTTSDFRRFTGHQIIPTHIPLERDDTIRGATS